MRNGVVVASMDSALGRRDEMVRAMIGRDPETTAVRRVRPSAEPAMVVDGLTLFDTQGLGKPRASDIGFTVHRGEILGLFGLVGAGRTEVARALFGDWPGRVRGRVRIGETERRPTSPREAIAMGLGMLTENRKQTGIIEGQSVLANMSAASLDDVSGRVFVDDRRERERGDAFLRKLDVRPPRLDIHIQSLSGGNQQKVLLARWIATKPKVLILDEPTLGVDVGARFELYRLIRVLADEGCAILLISSDLNEVIEECDRILVMYKGRLTAEFEHDASRHAIMAAATGERS
jgi:ABC-type sugar transport system ATPase subunit